MAGRFGKHHPALLSSRHHTHRERLLFGATVGLALSLMAILVLVFEVEKPSDKEDSSVLPVASVISTFTVITPTREVPRNTPLDKIPMETMYWPVTKALPGAIRDKSELRGMYARERLFAGSPITQDLITAEVSFESLQPRKGYRLVTLPTDEVGSVENHAGPGSRVDVILTYHNEKKQLISKAIAQNVLVLSLGGRTKRQTAADGRRGHRMDSRTVTLEVIPKDAINIQLWKKKGTLELLIRNQTDNAMIADPEFTATEFNKDRSNERKSSKCKRHGRVKFHGEEYVVDCNNALVKLDPYDP